MLTLAVGVATFAVLIGFKQLRPRIPAPLVAIGGAIAAAWYFGLQDKGVSLGRPDSAGIPSLDAARPDADRAADSGRARHRA